MYKYSNNLLPESTTLLYLRSDTQSCHQLKVLPGAKTFSSISAQTWNVLSNKINCDIQCQ